MNTISSLASMLASLAPAPVRDAVSVATETAIAAGVAATDSDWVPDTVLRAGIRALLRQRDGESHVSAEAAAARTQAFVDELRSMPVAIKTDLANEQHYEVPTEYFLAVLGPKLKYSSCVYADLKKTTLEEAEVAMLELACERADLQDGQDVLELGCGWGSLALFASAKFPQSRYVAVSNSRTQKQFIDARAKELGVDNLTVVTADAAEFVPEENAFDRCVSVEMFEHMKNYATLLSRISNALRDGGKLFVHIFVHRSMPYHFESSGGKPTDWMAQHFFSGGTMPSADLLPRFCDQNLSLVKQWAVSGNHYSRTLEDWLVRHDAARATVLPLFERTYGNAKEARRWFARWRIFYLACSELFAYGGGDTWFVAHYLFEKKKEKETTKATTTC